MLTFVSPVSAQEALGIVGLSTDAGIIVRKVICGSPASRAGVRVGDIITHINGSAPKMFDGEAEILSSHKFGETIHVALIRHSSAFHLLLTLKQSARAGVQLNGGRLSEPFRKEALAASRLIDISSVYKKNSRLDAKINDATETAYTLVSSASDMDALILLMNYQMALTHWRIENMMAEVEVAGADTQRAASDLEICRRESEEAFTTGFLPKKSGCIILMSQQSPKATEANCTTTE